MPAIPVPAVSTPVFQSWGKQVADLLNNGAIILAAQNNAAFSVPGDNTWYAVPMQTIQTDVFGKWNGTTHKYSIPLTGQVEVTAMAHMALAAATAAGMYADIWLNAIEYRIGYSQCNGNFGFACSGAHIFPVTAGDLLSLQVYFSGAAGVGKTVQTPARIALRYIAF